MMLCLNQLLYKELPYLHKTLQGGTMSTVSRSGCGLCSMSMVVDHLTKESLPNEDCDKMAEECGANRWTGTSIGVLDPSWKPGKFDEEGRAGKVDTTYAPVLSCALDVLMADTENRSPRFHLFRRKL